jgi:hypothetical protein
MVDTVKVYPSLNEKIFIPEHNLFKIILPLFNIIPMRKIISVYPKMEPKSLHLANLSQHKSTNTSRLYSHPGWEKLN